MNEWRPYNYDEREHGVIWRHIGLDPSFVDYAVIDSSNYPHDGLRVRAVVTEREIRVEKYGTGEVLFKALKLSQILSEARLTALLQARKL